MFDKWLKVEPQPRPVYKSAENIQTLKLFGLYLAIGLIQQIVSELLFNSLHTEILDNGRRGFTVIDNGIAYIIYLFFMMGPLIAGGMVFKKTTVPMYGFSVMAGFTVSGLIYAFSNPFGGLYYAFSAGTLILANLVSQKEWIIKNWHFLYFALFGVLVCFGTLYVMDYFGDIWTYLQFIHFHLLLIIVISLKIPQWGHFFLIGWAIASIIAMLTFGHDYFLYALYSFIAPLLLTGTALYYFYRIYLPHADQFRNKPDQKSK